jgi:hypothetical protein
MLGTEGWLLWLAALIGLSAREADLNLSRWILGIMLVLLIGSLASVAGSSRSLRAAAFLGVVLFALGSWVLEVNHAVYVGDKSSGTLVWSLQLLPPAVVLGSSGLMWLAKKTDAAR